MLMDHTDPCAALQLLQKDVEFLKSQQNQTQGEVRDKYDRLEARMAGMEVKIDTKIDGLDSKVTEALAGRPTWATTIVVGVLSTLATGMGVYLLTH